MDIPAVDEKEDYGEMLRGVGLMTTGARGAFDNF